MYDESDCCGNGCANCVLDIKPQKVESTTSKKNIIDNYSKFLLKSKKQFGELVFELHFISVEITEKAEHYLNIPSGHHVMMRAPLQAQTNVTELTEKRLLRPYSPFFVDKNELEFKVLVNLSPNGQMSKYISSLNVDDKVEFRGPIGGHYIHDCTTNLTNLILISHGVAISPTIPIINEILDNPDDMTRIYQFACFTDLKNAYFRKELQEYNKFWNYTSFIYLSRQFCDKTICIQNKGCLNDCQNLRKNLIYKEKVYAKRFNSAELLQAIGKNSLLSNTKFVVCGSRQFQNQILDDIKSLNLEICQENIFLL